MKILFSAVVISIGIFLFRYLEQFRSVIPSHLLGHRVEYINELISEEAATELNALIRTMGFFPSNIAADLKTGGFSVTHEHIGEATPTERDGQQRVCTHPFLVPNANRTLCTLPQRVDVGRHFVLTGGVDGNRENYDILVRRVTSFGRYMLGSSLEKFPSVQRLFETEKFVSAAKRICPSGASLLDPFQFNIIMQIPGQTVASHLDAPYFWGADRFDFPQWLLMVMKFSGIYENIFIHQVQVVGYLSPEPIEGGEFIYYPENANGEFKQVPAVYRAGSTVDGSKTIHASRIFRPKSMVPALDKDKDSALVYEGSEKWLLQVDNLTVATYHSRDLRISIVYRARCFADDTARERHAAFPISERLKLETVIATLLERLVLLGELNSEQIPSMSRLEIAQLLMLKYIRYPLPPVKQAIFPYNYCALSRLYPWALPILKPFCPSALD